MTREYSDYLAHHGVKGQKWGVRRYQNEDGTLKNPKDGENKKDLSLWQRLTHDKKEGIRQKALEQNNYKKQLHEMQRDDWNKEAKRVQSLQKEYTEQENYKADLAFARHQAELSQKRVDAWMRREKRLLNMNVDELSTRQVKKATKLKWHEYAYPDD